jgi:hypothetical protein
MGALGYGRCSSLPTSFNQRGAASGRNRQEGSENFSPAQSVNFAFYDYHYEFKCKNM